jgi:hypothetical protein
MYFANFALALEEVGASVLAICPSPDEGRSNVERLREQRGLSRPGTAQTVYRKLVLPALRLSRLFRGRLRTMAAAIHHFRVVEHTLKKWQAESGKRVDLVFYACIYDWDFQWFHWAQPFLSLPWSGLYLHALSFRMPGKLNPKTNRLPCPERIFRGSQCKGLAILDEGIASQVADVTGKPVVVLPDLPDERLPAQAVEGSLGHRLSCCAGGSTIVGLFGYLQPSKGLIPLLQASQHPSLSNVCFAFGGETCWPLFSSHESRTICNVLTRSANTWNHLMRIPEEEQLNSALSVCDVLYAAYLDFPHSSGIVAKAAAFKKPLIVSDGYLMAERVRRFRMGEVVPEGNVEAIVNAIAKLTTNPAVWVAENQPRWSEYMIEHSFARLKDSFRELLAKF